MAIELAHLKFDLAKCSILVESFEISFRTNLINIAAIAFDSASYGDILVPYSLPSTFL
jgi:hypothetical protein